jgi:ADP-ribosylglycohydrolase
MVAELLKGQDITSAWNQAKVNFREARIDHAQSAELSAFAGLLTRDYATSNESKIESSGYVIHTLEAAVWCLMTTTDFPSCVLKAVNLGSDTDTTGCVAGGLAGLYYGVDSIPADWLAALPRQSDLTELFQKFINRNPTC